MQIFHYTLDLFPRMLFTSLRHDNSASVVYEEIYIFLEAEIIPSSAGKISFFHHVLCRQHISYGHLTSMSVSFILFWKTISPSVTDTQRQPLFYFYGHNCPHCKHRRPVFRLLKPRLHDTTGCHPVEQPVWQRVVSCKRGLRGWFWRFSPRRSDMSHDDGWNLACRNRPEFHLIGERGGRPTAVQISNFLKLAVSRPPETNDALIKVKMAHHKLSAAHQISRRTLQFLYFKLTSDNDIANVVTQRLTTTGLVVCRHCTVATVFLESVHIVSDNNNDYQIMSLRTE